MFIILESFMYFFWHQYLSWGQAGKQETVTNCNGKLLSCVWMCVQWWLWGEQALLATRSPTCRGPMDHGPVRTYPEPEFSPASLNVTQMVRTKFCPFLCQTHTFFFFFFNSNVSYFHLPSQRELYLLWRTGNWFSSSLSSVPLVTVLCLQDTQPYRTRCSGCCASSTCIRRF